MTNIELDAEAMLSAIDAAKKEQVIFTDQATQEFKDVINNMLWDEYWYPRMISAAIKAYLTALKQPAIGGDELERVEAAIKKALFKSAPLADVTSNTFVLKKDAPWNINTFDIARAAINAMPRGDDIIDINYARKHGVYQAPGSTTNLIYPLNAEYWVFHDKEMGGNWHLVKQPLPTPPNRNGEV